MDALGQLKSAGLVRFVGVGGEGEAIDSHIGSGAFDILQTPFNLTSGWSERRRIKAAGEANMSVIGYGSFPDGLRGVGNAQALAKPARSNPLADSGTYGFLETTPGWKPDEICLAYALTEPALASVLVRPLSSADVERLGAIADRDMPPGLAAQIEMARFAPQTAAAPQAIRRRA
jgi:aryl-alcohol dehydrogenase-like predicted oxidoreductase